MSTVVARGLGTHGFLPEQMWGASRKAVSRSPGPRGTDMASKLSAHSHG
ncbi:hypothetical protein HMPREF9946_00890 [Acetobacteraceae bacterium AT-5844]|nr:hypothetical protein HMPREF9946_00890 [Acetobacteraceae bacterium AT-5844]